MDTGTTLLCIHGTTVFSLGMASALSCPTSATLRMNPVHLKTQSTHLRLQKVLTCSRAQISVPLPKCSCKINAVPLNRSGSISGPNSGVEISFEIGRKQSVRHVAYSVLSPSSSLRSDIGDDFSSNISLDFVDLELQLQELFDEVKKMIRVGNKEEAKDLLEANYEAVREQIDSGTQGIVEAALLDVVLLGYMAVGDLRTVGSLIDVLHKIVDGLKDEENHLDSILMHMGSMYAKLEKFELSACLYRRSVQIMEKFFGHTNSFLCTPLLGMAKVQAATGRTTEAIEIYHRVIKILEYCRGENVEELVVPLSTLGNLLMKEGKTLDAECQFNRVLNIYVRLYGEKDGRVGIAMCSLAQVKCAKGDVNKAIDLYESAIDIFRDSNGMEMDVKVTEKMRIDLAELLHVAGRGKEGRVLLEECLLITEKINGKDHPSLVPHLVNLATSYSRSKNFAEAERLLKISLQIMMKSVPPDDPSITFPMLHLAVTLYNLHRDDEAEKLALDVLCIREKAFGKESLPVGEALDCLVSIQIRLEKDDNELVGLLRRVLKIQEKAFGDDSEQVMETLKKIVHYMDKMGMKNEKYPLQRRLSMLRSKHKQMVMSSHPFSDFSNNGIPF